MSTEPEFDHLDTREIGGREIVLHWRWDAPEAFCVDSGRAVRYEAGDRCLSHGAADRPCTTALRMPPECRHEHLSPNHPYPHCSECGQTAEDVTAELAARPAVEPTEEP